MTDPTQPLAARMRPTSLDDVIGQDHILEPGSSLRRLADGTRPKSAILWGPPGTGKTTIARAIAATTQQHFIEMSATSAKVADIRKAMADAKKRTDAGEGGTILFLDEFHALAKNQQDTLLPAVEDSTIILIGATTENPSFSINSALISRAPLRTLKPLGTADIEVLLRRAIVDKDGLDGSLDITDEAVTRLADLASSDARQALTHLEEAAEAAHAQNNAVIDVETVDSVIDRATARYDRTGDQHYDIVSAFIKSMRGSDPDAALHWLARMIESGEDPRFIARRIVIHASEDVGMAGPDVLPIAHAASYAVATIGMPEARINLAQAVIAIAVAPKSNEVIRAINRALEDVRQGRTGEVPVHLRDSHYPGAKALGHGVGYQFPHNFEHGLVQQQYLPDGMENTVYYRPTNHGFEGVLKQRLANIDAIVKPLADRSGDKKAPT